MKNCKEPRKSHLGYNWGYDWGGPLSFRPNCNILDEWKTKQTILSFFSHCFKPGRQHQQPSRKKANAQLLIQHTAFYATISNVTFQREFISCFFFSPGPAAAARRDSLRYDVLTANGAKDGRKWGDNTQSPSQMVCRSLKDRMEIERRCCYNGGLLMSVALPPYRTEKPKPRATRPTNLSRILKQFEAYTR